MKPIALLFTCEHASNLIPENYQHLFKNKHALLKTHRGFDHGSKEIGKYLARHFRAPLVMGKFSRLLIDLNRSPGHKTAFSEMTKTLSTREKKIIKDTYHHPHWSRIQSIIDQKISEGFIVIHIGVHSFTPVLFNEVRNAEMGILYHPNRKKEADIATNWQNQIRSQSSHRVRRNYPYQGKMDGLSTNMRKLFPEKKYIAFEIEVNHAILESKKDLNHISKLLASSLEKTIFG